MMGAFTPTSRQNAVLRFVAGFVEQHGYGPSLKEIRDALGYTTKSAVFRLLKHLEERGAIERMAYRARAIRLTSEVPIPHAPDGAPLHFIPAERLERRTAA